MKYTHFFILIFVAGLFFTIYGCAENDLTDILFYETESNPVVHTAVPDDILNVMHRQIEFDFRNTHFGLQNTGAIEKWKAHFGEEPIEVSIQRQQEVQTAYYNRYIDAEGIAIVGNEAVEERHFINAKRVLLLMTAKHPDLRIGMQIKSQPYVLERGFYFILYNPGPVRYSPLTGEPFPVDQNKSLSQVPEFYLQFLFKTGFYGWGEIGTCFVTHDIGEGGSYSPRISSHIPAEYWAYGTELWFYEISKGRTFETYEDFKSFDPLLYDLLSEWYPKISLIGY